MAFKFFTVILTVLCLVLPALADDFKDFRIPTHRVTSLAASLDGWYNTRLTRPRDSRESSSNWYGYSNVRLFHLIESDRFSNKFYLSGSVNDQIESEQSRYPTSDTSRTSGHGDGNSLSESASGSWDGAMYPWSMPIGLQLSVDASGYWTQNWSSRTWTDHYPTSQYTSVSDDEEWFYHYSVSGSAQAGWGRIRDASGIYAARIMEQRLRETGVITGELQAATVQRLAELIYRRNDFYYKHERDERYYWQEVEAVLRSDSAFHAERFDAYNVFLSGDPVFSNVDYRPVGYFVGPVVNFTHSDDISRDFHLRISSDRDTLEYSNDHSRSHYDRVMAGVSARCERPVGLQWHVGAETTFLVPARPDDEQDKHFQWRTSAYVNYALADRWTASYRLWHNRYDLVYNYLYSGSRVVQNSWSVSSEATLAYYVEDDWHIYAELDYSASGWRGQRYYYESEEGGEERTMRMRIGLSHSFIGSGGYSYW